MAIRMVMLNSNIRCIEIIVCATECCIIFLLNSNIRCIEITNVADWTMDSDS